MSTTIDEKVVSMKFDNSNFESNVSTSLSSIGKLKSSLDFSGASKGLESLGKAASGVDMSSMGSSVDSVKVKFSALETVAMTALSNITTQVMQTGQSILSALTIDPISSGFEEYETQINAIQTILANTESAGTTLDDVNAALDELNTYADKTIYNFTQMTKNIGTFTAAGIDLDTAVSAIQGIANLAAVSGSTSQQASTAMYQLSQALAAGTVKLMDWNSVVNAGMGGEIFKNALIETSELLGTGAEAYIEAEGSFRESLSEGWLTAEVLTETLKKFTTTGAVEYVSELTGLSTDLIDAELEAAEATYGESAAIEQASKALAEKSGYDAEEIESVLQLAQTAEDAATKVKTFTQLFDTLKEAAQSGWTQTWEILIGDFDEAKELLTEISDAVGGLISESADARNTFLSGGLSSGWKQLLNEGISDTEGFKEAIIETVRVTDEALAESLESADDWEDALREGWLTADILATSISSLADEVRDLSSDELDNLGYTRDQADALLELEQNVLNGSVALDEFVTKMDRLSGRENIIAAIRNACSALYDVFVPIKEAFDETFLSMTSEELWNLTDKIKELSESLVVTEEFAQDLKETFSGLFSVFHILWQAISAIVAGFAEIVAYVSPVIAYVAQFTAQIGEFISKVDYALKVSKLFSAAVQVVVEAVELLVDILSVAGLAAVSVFSEFMSTTGIPAIQKALAVLAELGLKVFDAFAKFMSNTGIPAIIRGLNSLGSVAKPVLVIFAEYALEAADAVGELVSDILGLEEINLSSIVQIFKNFSVSLSSIFKNLGSDIIDYFSGIDVSSAIDSIAKKLSEFASSVLGLKESINVGGIISSAFGGIASITSVFVNTISNAVSSLGVVFSALQSLVSSILQIFASVLILKFVVSISQSILKIVNAVANLVDSISEIFEGVSKIVKNAAGVVKSFKKVLNSFALAIKAEAILKIAEAILVIAGVVIIIAQIDTTKLQDAIVTVGLIGGLIVALSWAMSKLGAIDSVKSAASLIAFSASILILVQAISQLGQLTSSNLYNGSIATLGVLATGLAAFAIIISRQAGSMTVSSAFLLAFSASIYILTQAFIALNKLDTSNLLAKTGLLAGAVVALVAVIKACSGVGAGSALALLSVSAALVGVVTAFQVIANFDMRAIANNMDAMVGIFTTLIALVLLSKLGGASSASAGIGVVGMATSLLIIVQVLKQLGTVDASALDSSIATIAKVSAIFAALILVSAVAEHAVSAGAMLVMAATSFVLLSVALTLMSSLDPDGLRNATDAITQLGVVFAEIIAFTSLSKKCTATMVALTAALVSMSLSVAVLSLLDQDAITNATLCLTGLMGAFALMLAASSVATTAIPGIAVMGVAVAGLAVIIGLLAAYTDVNEALVASEALSLLLVSFAASIALAGTFGALAAAASPAIIEMTIVAGLLTAFIGLLANLTDVDDALVASEAISLLMVSMSASLLLISAAGALASVATVGLLLLIPALAALTLLAAGIGALLDWKPAISEFIDSGIDLFVDLAEGIGRCFSAFLVGSTENLPEMADNLSSFMEKLQPFLDGVSSINSAAIDGAASLINCITAITTASFTSWFSTGTAMDQFANDIAELTSALQYFAEGVSGISAEATQADCDAAITIANGLSEVCKSMPRSGGVWQLLTGEINYEGFKENAYNLGGGIATFAESVSGISAEATQADCDVAISIASSLADVCKTMSRSDGLWQLLVGSVNYEGFSDGIEDVGSGLSSFAESVSGISAEATMADCDAAVSVASSLTDVVSALPSSGGLWQGLFGSNNLGKFGDSIKQLATGLKDFATNVSGLSSKEADTSAAVQVTNDLVAVMDSISNSSSGGLLSWTSAGGSLSSFGSALKTFGSGLADYAEEISGIDLSNMSLITTQVGRLIDMVAEIQELSASVSTVSSFNAALLSLAESGMSAFSEAFNSSTSIATTAVSDWLQAAIDAASSSVISEKFKMVGEDAVEALIDGIASSTSSCQLQLRDLYVALGEYIVDGLVEGISAGKSKVANALVELSEDAESAFCDWWGITSPADVTIEDGEYIIGGLVEGIINGISDVSEALLTLSENAETDLRDWWGIHSNSDKTTEDGEYITGGLAEGISNGASSVISAFSNLFSGSEDVIDSGVSSITSSFSNLQDAASTFWDTLTSSDSVIGDAANSISELVTSITDAVGVTSTASETTEEATETVEAAAEAITEVTEAVAESSGVTEFASDVIDYFNERYGETLEQMLNIDGYTISTLAVENLAETLYAAAIAEEDLSDSTSSSTTTIASAFQDMRDSIADSVESSIDLFSQFDASTEVTASEVLNNMESQIIGITQWSNNIEKLAEKGISSGLLEYLVELGTSGYQYVAAFVDMTADELALAEAYFASSLLLPDTVATKIAASYAYAGLQSIEGFTEALSSTNATEEFTETLEDASEIVEDFSEVTSDSSEVVQEFTESMEEATSVEEENIEVIEDSTEAITENSEAVTEASELSVEYNENTELLTETITEAVDAEDALTESTLNNAEATAEAIEQLSEYRTFYSSMNEVISSSINLFESFEATTEMTAEEMLANMQSQIEGIKTWAQNLQTLAERGISQGLLQELAELGPDGSGYEYVNAFVQMSAEQLAEANALYETSLTLPESVATQIADSYSLAGQMASAGFASGIDTTAGVAEVVALADANLSALETELEEQSPSKATYRMGEYFVIGFTNGISDATDEMGESAAEMATAVLTALEECLELESFTEYGSELVAAILVGMNEAVAEATEEADPLSSYFENLLLTIQTTTETLMLQYEVMYEIGMNLVVQFMLGMQSQEEVLYELITLILDSSLLLITDRYEEIQNDGVQMLTLFLTGIKSVKATLIAYVTAMLVQMISTMRSYYTQFYQAGSYLMEGFTAGILAGIAAAVAAAQSAAAQVSAALSSALDEASPSKLTYEMGVYFMEGLANGIDACANRAAEAAGHAGDLVAGAMQQALLNVSYWIEYEMDDEDLSPTIRPVIDLDQLKVDAIKMAALLSISDPIATASLKAGSLSGHMNEMNDYRMNFNDRRLDRLEKLMEDNSGANYNFTQNNYSPKSLSRIDIYRQTKSQFSAFERMAQG